MKQTTRKEGLRSLFGDMSTRRIGYCAVGAFLSASAVARPDLNAFLNERAMTVAQLVAQTKRDPQVMDRYKRHFAMSESEVVSYLSGLRLARLKEAGVYKIYSVPPGEWIKMRYDSLRKGSPVFADANGAPILLVKCGNPLTQGPKSPIAENEPVAAIGERTEVLKELTVAADTPLADDLVALMPQSPQLPPEKFISTDQSPVTILPGAFGLSPWLIAPLGILFIDQDDEPIDNPVPDPATLAVLGFGLVGLAARSKRKRYRSGVRA